MTTQNPDQIRVTKRNGNLEALDIEKIHRVIMWAAEGLEDVSVSEVEMRAHLQFYDGIPTKDIHELVVKAAADLITEEESDYQYFAARLAMFGLRKTAYGQFNPPSLEEHIRNLVAVERYDEEILKNYTSEELAYFDSVIQHERDLEYSYTAVKQFEGKYLVKDRSSNRIFETPQFINILAPMNIFMTYPKEQRKDLIVRMYNALIKDKLSLPTPIMSGVRTPTRQFSSCTLIDSDDTLSSITATSEAIVGYAAKRAGIGINAGRIRSNGAKIREGEAVSTGQIGFLKLFNASVGCCSQGGVRKGSATTFFPLWHLEAESLIELKNNRGTDENRVRTMDYGFQINKFLYTRLQKGQNITLFCPGEVPDLYEAFYKDQDEFARLYEKYERSTTLRKETKKASEIFNLLMNERAGTGRIYIQHVDHTNIYGNFIEEEATTYMSNLCLEITLPTKPLRFSNDPEGEIALCTLAAWNWGNIELDDFEDLADLIVRFLDALLDYQDYPSQAAKNSSMKRRTLGVGIINLAYWIAKRGYKYSDGSANNEIHLWMEHMQYHLMKASMNLAKEKGACPGFKQTKMSKGILPIDNYKKEVDQLHTQELTCDWEGLRKDIMKYGMRNSTLTALMPSETSSQISNATNGIEPPNRPVTKKASKDGILPQCVPEIKTLMNKYEYRWDWPDNMGYIGICGILQKFVCQAISANTNYVPAKFPNGKVPMKTLLKELLSTYKFGLKTLYYHNTEDGSGDKDIEKTDEGCEDGGCKI